MRVLLCALFACPRVCTRKRRAWAGAGMASRSCAACRWRRTRSRAWASVSAPSWRPCMPIRVPRMGPPLGSRIPGWLAPFHESRRYASPRMRRQLTWRTHFPDMALIGHMDIRMRAGTGLCSRLSRRPTRSISRTWRDAHMDIRMRAAARCAHMDFLCGPPPIRHTQPAMSHVTECLRIYISRVGPHSTFANPHQVLECGAGAAPGPSVLRVAARHTGGVCVNACLCVWG